MKKVRVILVVGCGGSAGENFIQSIRISPEEFYIIGVDINKFHLELSSADLKYLLPSNKSKRGYIKILNEIIKKHSVELIHPQPDPEVLFLAESADLIKTRTFLPNIRTIKICQNKFKTNKILKSKNIPVAESYLIKDYQSLVKAYGILIKKNEKLWLRATKGAGSKAALPINDLNHAFFWIDYWMKNKNIGYGDFMLSEFLPGAEFAFQSIWKDGKLITSQARKRVEYVFGNLTPSGQSSSPTVAVTINRVDINKIATKAIQAINPNASGIFCVDLKENKDGIPCVLEINAGRFFTTSNFFSSAGCNMPYIYFKAALGEKLPSTKKFNNLKENLYWLRNIDMGYKLISSNFNIDTTYAFKEDI